MFVTCHSGRQHWRVPQLVRLVFTVRDSSVESSPGWDRLSEAEVNATPTNQRGDTQPLHLRFHLMVVTRLFVSPIHIKLWW